jgi:hypothetical protein
MKDITLNGEWTAIGSYFTGSFDGNNKTITGLSIYKPNADNQGMFGFIDTGAEVKNLTLVDCDIIGNEYVGGLVGWNEGTITNSGTEGVVIGDNRVGGVVGYNETGMVINCHATGNISGNGYVGGVAGQNEGTITNSSTEGDVDGNQRVGGVVGHNNGTVENCHASGDISGRGTLSYVGGVVGSNGGIVEKCYATGNVRGIGGSYVGGVVGWNSGGTVEKCYATGNVSGTRYVGGVVGRNGVVQGALVKNSYATGNVDGTSDEVGGVVGNSQNGTVENCYAMGAVSGSNLVSGVVGTFNTVVINCVALNPNISLRFTYDSSSYGRVGVGQSWDPKLINNYARNDMLFNNSTRTWINNTSGDHGADITAENYHLESWWSNAAPNGPEFDFSATGAWEWHNANELPILKGFAPETQNPQIR